MAHSLKVVFRAELRGVAQAGDVKMVSPGFARNYLFPRQLAFPANASNVKQWESVRQGTLAKAQRRRESAQTLAQQVESATCAFTVKASPEGRLFGSIGRQDIYDALTKQGIQIDKHAVLLPKPIKQLGPTAVTVQLSAGVQAKLTVTVTAEQKD